MFPTATQLAQVEAGYEPRWPDFRAVTCSGPGIFYRLVLLHEACFTLDIDQFHRNWFS